MQHSQRLTFDSIAKQPQAPCVLYGEITELQGTLFASEEIAIHKAVNKRKREFRAGRTLVREAFQAIGFSKEVNIPVTPDRAPSWPEGIVGSITHTDTHCACAVATSNAYQSIGIDMETIGAVRPVLWGQVFTPSEQDHLKHLLEPERQIHASLFFCAKEAFYKWQYPLTKSWLNFTDANVRIDDTQTCTIHINENTPAGRIIRNQQGHYQITESNSVLCIFML